MDKSVNALRFFIGAISVICLLAGIYGWIKHFDGWGWFLFACGGLIIFLTATYDNEESPSEEKEDSK